MAWLMPLPLVKDFIGHNPSALVLGDNIFYGHDLHLQLRTRHGKAGRGDHIRLSRTRPRALWRGRL